MDPSLLEHERSVGEAIAKQAANQISLLSGKHTEEEVNAAAKKLTTLTTDYEQIQARIRESSPQYAALVQPVPLKVEEIQQRVLDADTLLTIRAFQAAGRRRIRLLHTPCDRLPNWIWET